MRLAELWVDIMGNDKPLNRTLANVRQALGGMAGGVGLGVLGGLDRGLARASSGIVAGMAGIGRAGGVALGVAAGGGVAAIGAGLAKSIDGAAHLTETISKVGVVFGESAGEVTSVADEMARAFGASRREGLAAAAQFGLIGQGMGQSQKEAAAFSAAMLRVAVDTKSFQDTPVPEVLEKIRAGLVGEYEPLRALGVTLDEESVKAKAVAMNLAKAGDELSNYAKFSARAALIKGGLKPGEGDMAATQTSASNQMSKLGGQMENLGDAVGAKLLPAFTDLLNMGTAALGGIAASFEAGKGPLFEFVGWVEAGFETIGLVWRNAGDVMKLVGINLAEVFLNIGERLEWLGGAFGAFLGWFGENWSTVIPDALNAVYAAFTNFAANVRALLDEVYDYLRSGFTDPIEIHFKPLLDGFEAKSSALQLPELKLSSLDAERAPILERIGGAELKRSNEKAAAAALAGPERAGFEKALDKTKKAKEEKASTTDLAGYAKQLQEGIFGKDAAKKTADNTTKLVQQTGQVVANLSKAINARAVATTVGPG